MTLYTKCSKVNEIFLPYMTQYADDVYWIHVKRMKCQIEDVPVLQKSIRKRVLQLTSIGTI